MKRRGRHAGGVSLVCLSLLASRPALADPPLDQPIPLRLTYTVAPGSSGCPSEETFKGLVLLHLEGRDPFTGNADSKVISVEVSHDGKAYKVDLTLRDPSGKTRLDGSAPIKGESCVSAVEAAGAVVVDLMPMRARAPAPEPVSSPKPPEVEVPAPPPKPPFAFRLGASVWGEYATVPGITPGITVSVGARYGYFSAALEGGWVAPAGLPLANGVKDQVTQLSGVLLLCGHVRWFVPCVLAQASDVQFTGTASAAPSASFLRGAGGARLAADLPLVPGRLFIQPAVDLLGAFGVSAAPSSSVVQLPGFNVALGLGAVVEIPGPGSPLP